MYFFLAKINHTILARLLDANFEIISEIRKEKGDLLKMVDFILKKNKRELKSIKGVFVVNDSGTFSGVRGAVTIGNVLSFALKIPVVAVSVKNIDDRNKLKVAFGKKIAFVMPKYDKEPNIT